MSLSINATGTQVIVKFLTVSDIYKNNLILTEDAKIEPPQAVVLDIGPLVNKEHHNGFQVGDRVVVSGPKITLDGAGFKNHACVEPYCIRAVISEKKDLSVDNGDGCTECFCDH